jgi:hypothetical protein
MGHPADRSRARPGQDRADLPNAFPYFIAVERISTPTRDHPRRVPGYLVFAAGVLTIAVLA